ncbi:sugar ABC transporter substrate-binding protein [Bariatricus massiliensis]|uniref:Sugar ABC transporter substrate-binding protein n=1 Tax=Bariatricus massiliensis TaxID=1745713 RepID=A0ABS8DKC5_9FIRM|nr:sugar ABC transporter substrate-binding protein [Bariatricus massiliensis]MCB7305740.1 sugar ABC transporter substrate-binding protein [Bariatricus massiliensis]MCB7376343.1 sugar ABC transporter substrate-binding protein [Bariatricus massiliensis]MCB7388883.1 sugar ABC transporter substrate-binding protein [Bariatricus massiliensis]MCB7413056.1 sugar ABC transporter substrate-binding protein [Bariatricus massiliensis]MCQ5254999.1 sugar ABC transporter substrate-binding protein [Bariatricus
MKKVLSVLLVMGMCVGLLAGCGGGTGKDDKGENGGETSDKKKIVFMVKNSNSDFFVSMGEYAKAKAEEYGWECEVLAPIEADNNEEQIQLLEQSLLDPPDAYCIVPADSDGITPAIEQINEADIPIINVNTMFYDEEVEYLTFVAIDNYGMAYECSKAGAELIGGKGNVLILEGTTGSQTSIDRQKGATDGFAEYPDITVLDSQTANYARQEALTVTQNLLQKYPEVDMIWSAAGEMALGAAEAVSQAGRSDEIKIVTINAFKEMIEAVIDGRIALTADDASWLQGETAIECLKKYWDGEELEEQTLIDAVMVTDENLDEYKEMWGIK